MQSIQSIAATCILLGGTVAPAQRATAPAVAWSAVVAGDDHSCGVTASGDAYCWGSHSHGQLGTGKLADQGEASHPLPMAVTGGLKFKSLVAGSEYTCGLTSDGAAYCWGYNYNGQLGNGAQQFGASTTSPVPVAGGLTFARLSAGLGAHTCALTGAGVAYCWGKNSGGQVGNGSSVNNVPTPTPVKGGAAFMSISVGYTHTCALTAAGAAYCWGRNAYGELGSGASNQLSVTTPVAVAGGLTFKSISAGFQSTCAVATDGTAYCWGQGRNGRLGTGSEANASTPARVTGGYRFTDVGVGRGYACGVLADGLALCWGDNANGRLGNGESGNERNAEPVHVQAPGVTFAAISAGGSHTCAYGVAGAYCWGANGLGSLGTGSIVPSASPVIVATAQPAAMHTAQPAERSSPPAVDAPRGEASVYRCWHFNGGNVGGTCRISTPLVFNADGSYQESTTRGTYTIVGDRVALSASTVRGPGRIDGNTIIFKYVSDNTQFTSTYLLQRGPALKPRKGSENP
jgi:alpha-tubulin suppressor-like RCC1 family protein